MGTISNKNVIVLGMGLSGRSAAGFLLARGASVLGLDVNFERLEKNSEILELKSKGLRLASDQIDPDFSNIDLFVLSPGITPQHPICEAARRHQIEIIGEIELGCRGVKNSLFGITGSNGKSTVTALTAHILNCLGVNAKAVGNIGIPLTQEIHLDSKSLLVMELSSFQLETLSQKVFDAGVILNITPNHLDRYENLEAYAQAKIHLQQLIKNEGLLIVEEKTWDHYKKFFAIDNLLTYGYSPSSDLFTDLSSVYFKGRCVGKLPEELQGKKNHELENILASYALCSTKGISFESFIAHLSTYKKLPHRIEFVTNKNGVVYYDDSKGTSIDAVIRAIEFLPGPIVLIAGGVDKGASYIPWVKAFGKKVKGICAIGQAAPLIHTELNDEIPVTLCQDLEHAVKYATSLANPGDQVLLSPGCSSYDMFKDYAHRGRVFQDIVKRIE